VLKCIKEIVLKEISRTSEHFPMRLIIFPSSII